MMFRLFVIVCQHHDGRRMYRAEASSSRISNTTITGETTTMSSFIVIAFASALASCELHKELQADMVNVELVKMDTVYRFIQNQKLLTWRCQNGVEFVSSDDIGVDRRIP